MRKDATKVVSFSLGNFIAKIFYSLYNSFRAVGWIFLWRKPNYKGVESDTLFQTIKMTGF